MKQMGNFKKPTKRASAGLLRKAARYITVSGFRKKDYGSHALGFCILGALGQTGYSGSRFLDSPVADYAATAMEKVLSESCGKKVNILRWNDHPSRTKDEVVRAARATARVLEHGLDMSTYVYGKHK